MADDPAVREVMTAPVATLRPDQPVTEAADELADRKIAAMPVVDGSGKLVGLLRDDDLVASEARVHAPTFFNFLGLGVPFPGEMAHLEKELKKIAGATVGDGVGATAVMVGTTGVGPERVRRPILLAFCSVNQRLQSGPMVTPCGALPAVGTAYSVKTPLMVTDATLLVCSSWNQRFPSGPAVMIRGPLLAVGTVY